LKIYFGTRALCVQTVDPYAVWNHKRYQEDDNLSIDSLSPSASNFKHAFTQIGDDFTSFKDSVYNKYPESTSATYQFVPTLGTIHVDA
jgi:hypothetical protein